MTDTHAEVAEYRANDRTMPDEEKTELMRETERRITDSIERAAETFNSQSIVHFNVDEVITDDASMAAGDMQTKINLVITCPNYWHDPNPDLYLSHDIVLFATYIRRAALGELPLLPGDDPGINPNDH